MDVIDNECFSWAVSNVLREDVMHRKRITLMAGAVVLASIGAANAREHVALSNTQLDAVTAGGVSIAFTPGRLIIHVNGTILSFNGRTFSINGIPVAPNGTTLSVNGATVSSNSGTVSVNGTVVLSGVAPISVSVSVAAAVHI
jgi:hypothetical protein